MPLRELFYLFMRGRSSQNDFFGIVIHEIPSPTIDNPKPVPLLRDIYIIQHEESGHALVIEQAP